MWLLIGTESIACKIGGLLHVPLGDVCVFLRNNVVVTVRKEDSLDLHEVRTREIKVARVTTSPAGKVSTVFRNNVHCFFMLLHG